MGLEDVVKTIVELPKDVYPKEVPKILEYIAKNCKLDIEYQEVSTLYSTINHKNRPRKSANYEKKEVKGFINEEVPAEEKIHFESTVYFPDVPGIFNGASTKKIISGKISYIEFSSTRETSTTITEIRNKIAEYFIKKSRKH